jgi:hypothetical protein
VNLVFTICSNNYLAQAITLGYSLLKHNPDYKFLIGLVDSKNSYIDYTTIPFEILEVDKIDISGFDELYKKYNITELNTAIKPFYFQYLFANRINLTSIIYLDPDILVYSPFTELEREFEFSDIIITPHFTTPLNDDKLQTEEDFLNSGLYNLGFIAIKYSLEGTKMLDWWSERLRYKAYIDFKRGLFTDQIWINFVPLYFTGVKIFTHLGYNMAYWNLHERHLSKKEENYFINDKYPLVFYHFSGYNPQVPEILSKYQTRFTFEERPDIVQLFKNYSAQLFINNYESFIGYQNKYSNIKNSRDRDIRNEKINAIPFFKRVLRILILKIINKLQIDLEINA